jgi:hypothetical protein
MYTSQLPNEGNLTYLELSLVLVGDALYRSHQVLPDRNDRESVIDTSFLGISMVQDLETQQNIGRVFLGNLSAAKTAISLELLMLSREVIPQGGKFFHPEGTGRGKYTISWLSKPTNEVFRNDVWFVL